MSAPYSELLRAARRWTKTPEAARDLVQTALAEAVARGFTDWEAEGTRRWLHGVIRRQAAFQARGAARRRRREQLWQRDRDPTGLAAWNWEGYLSTKLPGGTELGFFEGDATIGSSPQIVFGLDEGGIDAVAEQLAAQGAQLVTPVTEAPGGWAFEFGDPDGHKLAYYQDGALPRR